MLALAGASICLGLVPAGSLADAVTLSNDQVMASWKVEHEQLRPGFVQDRQTSQTIQPGAD